MNDIKEKNRNSIKTDQLIRTAFLDLMAGKKYTKITASKICEKANINRGTFYHHYTDIYDLMEKIENDVIRQIADSLTKINRNNYIDGQHPQHTGVFRVLYKNEDICRLLTGPNGDTDFVYRLMNVLRNELYASWSSASDHIVPDSLHILVQYVVGGICAMYLFILQNNESMVDHIEEFGYYAGEITNWIDGKWIRPFSEENKKQA